MPSFGNLARVPFTSTTREARGHEHDQNELSIAREVAALKQRTFKELRGRYPEFLGEATRSGNKDWLWKRLV